MSILVFSVLTKNKNHISISTHATGVSTEESCSVARETIIMELPTQTASELAIPACTTFAGSIMLQGGQEANFDGYETINGSLSIYKKSPKVDFLAYSDTLLDINGTLFLGPARTTIVQGNIDISFPALEHLTELRVDAPFDFVTLTFGPNLTVDAIHVAGIHKGYPLYLNITTISGGNRTYLDDKIIYNESKSFYSPVVLLNTSLTIAWNLFTSMEFPNAETIYEMNIHENRELETISIAASSAAALSLFDNGRTTSARLPRLANLTGNKYTTVTLVSEFANLVDLQLPVLQEVSSRLYSIGFENNLFAELQLPRLEKANTSVVIQDNSVLSDVIVPRLSVVGDLEIKNNPRLLNFTANSLRWAKSVDLKGNFTNVELFLLKEVVGDFSIIGTSSMDCSWFDDNLFQKVIKGSYRCEGNHTRPAVPRSPSTPTVEDPPTVKGDGDEADSDEGKQVDGSGEGLSTGAKAGIGAGAGLGGLIVVAGFFFFWRNKTKDKGALAGSGGMGEGGGGGLPEADGNALPPPELDDTKHPAERESKPWEGGELDTSPREQAGTREELHDTSVRAELSPTAVKGRGMVELPA